MKLFLKRAIAASVPCALLAATSLAAGANTTFTAGGLSPFGFRSLATTPSTLGGGATLPVPAYLGKSVGGGYESSGTTSFGVAGSLFGYLATQSGGLNIDYCATGSGKGKGVFAGAAGTVDILCSNAKSGSGATTFGFAASTGGTLKYPSATGTDAPLLQSDYNTYLSTHASPIEPVELPSVFGAIAVIYRDDALSSTAARITLTDAQICGIYNGSITTFGKLLGNADATPIKPIYRADGSGTSFNFSNHLATVCAGYNGNQTFTVADPKLPASSIGETGNGGVLAGVIATNGGIGYVEAGYLTNNPSGKGHENYANVKNTRNGAVYDPFSGLPVAAATVTSPLLSNVQVIQGTGPATVANLTGVRSGSCVKVVNPSTYANVASGYPIVAVTYLLFNSAGNGFAGSAGLRLLEQDIATPTLFRGAAGAKVTTIDEAGAAGTTGYSSLSSAYSSVVKSTATSCINN